MVHIQGEAGYDPGFLGEAHRHTFLMDYMRGMEEGGMRMASLQVFNKQG